METLQPNALGVLPLPDLTTLTIAENTALLQTINQHIADIESRLQQIDEPTTELFDLTVQFRAFTAAKEVVGIAGFRHFQDAFNAGKDDVAGDLLFYRLCRKQGFPLDAVQRKVAVFNSVGQEICLIAELEKVPFSLLEQVKDLPASERQVLSAEIRRNFYSQQPADTAMLIADRLAAYEGNSNA